MIVRLSPPAREETLPAPLAEAPPPPAPLSTLPSAGAPAAVEPPPPVLAAGDSGVGVVPSSVTPVAATVSDAGGKKPSAAAAVPLEAVRNALVAVASVRPLLARRVARAILDRTARAVSAALKE